ncbi:MAG: beta-phosphoglucomutase [Colwellia sp.]|nr:beta-phosphoglucomutase [Colwellia sp.]MCW8865239.1 beta-phosphoglucomutase [Colwellia sp.]MCW9081287.1 beta-phosphoglucomutase [Colwellia sp.]
MMKIDAVIFDLDGVLTDTAEFHFIAWRAIAHKLGVEFSKEDNEALKGVDREDSLKYILAKGKITVNASEFEELLKEKNNHYLTLINDINPSHLFDGVLHCFSILKKANIKIGLASASKNASLVINKLGIDSLFDFVGDAAAVAHSKPAPDIFLSVAQGLNVAPHNCIGVEDAVAGVTAIQSAKMFAVGIGERHVLTQAELVFPTMSEFDFNAVLATFSSRSTT